MFQAPGNGLAVVLVCHSEEGQKWHSRPSIQAPGAVFTVKLKGKVTTSFKMKQASNKK